MTEPVYFIQYGVVELQCRKFAAHPGVGVADDKTRKPRETASIEAVDMDMRMNRLIDNLFIGRGDGELRQGENSSPSTVV
jgi:hypothetical protein